MRTALTSVALLISLVTPSIATTTIMIWSSDTLTIGADSKTSSFDHSKSYSTCKVHVTNNVMWTYAGISTILGTKFSMDEFITNAISTSSDVQTALNKLVVSLTPDLVEVLRSLKADDPVAYLQKREGQAFLEVAASNIESDAIHIRLMQFIPHAVASSGAINLEIKELECPNSYCGAQTYIALGRHETADTINQTDILATLGAQGAIKKMIELEIASYPEEVGLPVVMAEFTRSGLRWIAKGECQE